MTHSQVVSVIPANPSLSPWVGSLIALSFYTGSRAIISDQITKPSYVPAHAILSGPRADWVLINATHWSFGKNSTWTDWHTLCQPTSTIPSGPTPTFGISRGRVKIVNRRKLRNAS